ncbi:MAG: ABC transporter substrate-binding protein [Actinomycetota bacterium]
MMKRSILGISMAAALTLSACGGGDSSSDTTAPAEDTTPAAGAIDLTGVCPAKVILQTDWNPESEHGMLYQLIGPGYEVDTEKVAVRGDLVANGQPTGVQVEVRPGGPAVGYQQVTALLYQDPEIMLGFTSTDEAVSNSVEKPTKAVFAPFVKNPQIIMWDPASYPEAKTIADLKEPGVKVRYFDGAAYMDYFTANGILDKGQTDGTYDGTPASFVAAGGKDAQQGFGTAEPYFYEKVLKDWMKPVAYEYIHDAGWTAYASSLGGTPESLEKNAECLKKLVPIMQQALADYVASPDTTNAMILDAVNQFNNGWVYDAGQAAASVEKQLADALVANSTDGTLGSFDLQRVTDFIALAEPVYAKTGAKVKEGLTAEDIVTNEFIDPNIKLG